MPTLSEDLSLPRVLRVRKDSIEMVSIFETSTTILHLQ